MLLSHYFIDKDTYFFKFFDDSAFILANIYILYKMLEKLFF